MDLFLLCLSRSCYHTPMKIVAQNRKAYHDYSIEETAEAGIQLLGTEVKSLRDGKANLKDSYVLIKDAEVFLFNCHISPYSHGNIMNHDPLRTRKLLLHRKEIERIKGKAQQKGYTLVPLKIYFKGPFAKVEIGLARGKKVYEKRETIKEREAKRDIERAMKNR
ncbi:MAG: SsrA-binding protein SmpB [Thermodesulfovibrionales bacterium]